MKNKLILSITMTSAACFAIDVFSSPQTNTPTTVAQSVERVELHSGKCASGKCGTEKNYAASVLTYDPQDRLVLARDGKCGLSGQGVAANTNLTTALGTCSDGVCGQ